MRMTGKKCDSSCMQVNEVEYMFIACARNVCKSVRLCVCVCVCVSLCVVCVYECSSVYTCMYACHLWVYVTST